MGTIPTTDDRWFADFVGPFFLQSPPLFSPYHISHFLARYIAYAHSWAVSWLCPLGRRGKRDMRMRVVIWVWDSTPCAIIDGRRGRGAPTGAKQRAALVGTTLARCRRQGRHRIETVRSRRKAAGAFRMAVPMTRVAPTQRAIVLRVALTAAQIALAVEKRARRGDARYGRLADVAVRRSRLDAALVGKHLARGRRCAHVARSPRGPVRVRALCANVAFGVDADQSIAATVLLSRCYLVLCRRRRHRRLGCPLFPSPPL